MSDPLTPEEAYWDPKERDSKRREVQNKIVADRNTRIIQRNYVRAAKRGDSTGVDVAMRALGANGRNNEQIAKDAMNFGPGIRDSQEVAHQALGEVLIDREQNDFIKQKRYNEAKDGKTKAQQNEFLKQVAHPEALSSGGDALGVMFRKAEELGLNLDDIIKEYEKTHTIEESRDRLGDYSSHKKDVTDPTVMTLSKGGIASEEPDFTSGVFKLGNDFLRKTLNPKTDSFKRPGHVFEDPDYPNLDRPTTVDDIPNLDPEEIKREKELVKKKTALNLVRWKSKQEFKQSQDPLLDRYDRDVDNFSAYDPKDVLGKALAKDVAWLGGKTIAKIAKTGRGIYNIAGSIGDMLEKVHVLGAAGFVPGNTGKSLQSKAEEAYLDKSDFKQGVDRVVQKAKAEKAFVDREVYKAAQRFAKE